MDVFNALWDNAEQRRRPPDDNFKLFTMEEWFALSSTHKILSGSLKSPLPPELELADGKKSCENYDKIAVVGDPSQIFRNPARPQTTLQSGSDTVLKKSYIPGLTKYPEPSRVSSLSIQEHKDCLKLLQKFDGKDLTDLSSTEKAELHLFQSLFIRVKEEQKEFLERAEHSWPEYVIRTCRMRADPNNFILQLWKDNLQHALVHYPSSYKKLKVITLDHKRKTHVNMLLMRNLLNIGRVPLVKAPLFDRPFRIATRLVVLRTWGLFNMPPSQLKGSLHKIPVSRDPNAERLARHNGASVVISSSGFKCLLDNYDEVKHPSPSGVGKSWVLPIAVREHRSFENGKPVTKTVVFIDKVLPQSKMSGFEKVHRYQKHALLAALTHRLHAGGIEFDIKGQDYLIKKEMADSVMEMQISDVGDTSSTPTVFKREQQELMIPVATLNSEGLGEGKAVSLSQQQNIMGDCDSSSVPVTSNLKQSQAACSSQPPIVTKVVGNSSSVLVSSTLNQNQIQDDNSSDDDSLVIALSDDETVKPMELGGSSHQSETHEKHKIRTKSNDFANLDALKKNEVHEITIESSHESSHAENFKQETYSGKAPQMKSTNRDTLSCLAERQKTALPPSVSVVNGNALPLNTTNVTYNLWSLQPQPVEMNSKERKSESNADINLLIRSRIDGCELTGSGNYELVSLASKPEFQLEYGAGAVTLGDLTRQWAKLLIQPDTRLTRVRVNVTTDEMVKLEKRTKEEVEHEAQTLHQEDLNNTLGTLYGVLADIVKLPRGEYILSHSPEMGLTAQLLVKAEEEPSDWNLSSECGNLPKDINCDTPWQPLDTTAIMPRNLFFHQMPCTFQSRRDPKTYTKKHQPFITQMKKVTAANESKKRKNAKKSAARAKKKQNRSEGTQE